MTEATVLEILDKVYEQQNFDFRQYKESSLERRIARRLRATKSESYSQYIDLLDKDPSEYTKLVDSITINVTEFFRNPEAWQILRQQVVSQIIKSKTNHNSTIRVWCAGCATGQEPYSITILIHELLSSMGLNLDVEVWATDIDKPSLSTAIQGKYNSNTIESIPNGILEKYFDRHEKYFEVKASIKKCVHFMKHDMVLDKPLMNMDLILCRNVAIYFTRPLQEKILGDFYSGLNDSGFLFLGKAESLVGSTTGSLEAINKKWRIYKKR